MIINGNNIEELKKFDDNYFDSIVTDPPYEIGFMGKSWDASGIANNPEMWSECLRVLKPGGYLLSFSATRTYHRMAVAIEDSGFEIRDMIEWVYGSGFPKSLNIGKAVDKLQGNEREITGNIKAPGYAKKEVEMGKQNRSVYDFVATKGTSEWEGKGTALKPAHEPICMVRKPLAEKTVAENVLKYGTGGINIDESRVEIPEGDNSGWSGSETWNEDSTFTEKGKCTSRNKPTGRFPANFIHDNSEEVRECFPNESERFFKSIIYQAKASKSERGTANSHPTVKPVALMEYLIKMVTPTNGIVLDPFMGSGSTGVACVLNDFEFVGIDLDKDYCEIARARIEGVKETQTKMF
jgi:DNA modification methylase